MRRQFRRRLTGLFSLPGQSLCKHLSLIPDRALFIIGIFSYAAHLCETDTADVLGGLMRRFVCPKDLKGYVALTGHEKIKDSA